MSLPFYVLAVEGALRTRGASYDVVAATLGADRWTTFRRVTLPLALPGVLAGCALAWARSLPATDDVRRRLATDALRAFDELGARPWAAQARGLLAEAGGEASHEKADPLAPLSARERTVALSVARGLSNKEIATDLFISRKTVDAHLQQVYRKLSLRSRTQLAALCHAGTVDHR